MIALIDGAEGTLLQSIETEKQKIKSEVKRLFQENAWLRDELAAAQKKLQESEQYSAKIEVELSHLKFLKEMKKLVEDANVQQQQQITLANNIVNNDDSSSSTADAKKIDLTYSEDQEDQSQTNCNCTNFQ